MVRGRSVILGMGGSTIFHNLNRETILKYCLKFLQKYIKVVEQVVAQNFDEGGGGKDKCTPNKSLGC